MIACLDGELLYKSPEKIVINIGGIGYEVLIPQSGFNRLPDTGQQIFMHTYTYVREEALSLFGFFDLEEKEMFLLLIGVSGVGPKLALNILSGIGPADFSHAILADNIFLLTKLPGVGKKTAERLCLELKDKVRYIAVRKESARATGTVISEEDRRNSDALSALLNLGYTQIKAREAIAAVRREEPDTFAAMKLEELLRHALRTLA